MPRTDPPDSTDSPPARPTRRTVLAVATGGIAGIAVAPILGRPATEAQPTPIRRRQIELGGRVSGWRGRSPPSIEGATNPMLPLLIGRTYEVTWENLDGAPHNFAIVDGAENTLVSSDIMSEQGATQTVEFTVTDAMATYLCEVHPNTMRGDVAPTPPPTPTQTTTVPGTGTGTPTEPKTETGTETAEGPPTAGFVDQIIEEERGDVARITVELTGTDRARISVGSRRANFLVRFDVVDGSDDGRVTVAFDTRRAASGRQTGISTVAAQDRIENHRLVTGPLPDPIVAFPYELEARVDDRLTGVGTLRLLERRTHGARTLTAPPDVDPDSPSQFLDATTPRSEIAIADWVVTEVHASGLYATLDGMDDLLASDSGLSLSMQEVDVMNREPRTVDLASARYIGRPARNRFYVVENTADLWVDQSYESVFRVTDRYPYVPDGEEETARTVFELVPRTASIDTTGGRVVVPAGDAVVSGEATIAPGMTITIQAHREDPPRFLKSARAEIDDDGSWSVTFDFSDIEPGTTFRTRAFGYTDWVDSVVVADDAPGA